MALPMACCAVNNIQIARGAALSIRRMLATFFATFLSAQQSHAPRSTERMRSSPPLAHPDLEGWRHIEDPTERRRIQNRNAQRTYRRRKNEKRNNEERKKDERKKDERKKDERKKDERKKDERKKNEKRRCQQPPQKHFSQEQHRWTQGSGIVEAQERATGRQVILHVTASFQAAPAGHAASSLSVWIPEQSILVRGHPSKRSTPLTMPDATGYLTERESYGNPFEEGYAAMAGHSTYPIA